MAVRYRQPHDLDETRDPGQSILPIFAKLRSLLNVKNVDLCKKFQQYDPDCTGIVSENEFKMVLLGMAGCLNLSDDDLDFITRVCVAKDCGKVDYKSLLDFIYKKESPKYEKILTTDLNMHISLPGDPASAIREEYLNSVLDEITLRIQVLGLPLCGIFDTIDGLVHLGGFIHANALHDALTKFGINVTKKDFDMIVHRYQVNSIFLHKKTLYEDLVKSSHRLSQSPNLPNRLKMLKLKGIDSLVEPHYEILRRHDSSGKGLAKNYNVVVEPAYFTATKESQKENVYNAMSRIQKHLYIKEISPTAYFSEYDKHNSGKITKSQFLNGLDHMGVSQTGAGVNTLLLRNDELEDIANVYTCITQPGYIYWRKFVEDLQDVYCPRTNDPDAVISSNHDPSENVIYLNNRLSTGLQFTKSELRSLENLLDSIRQRLIEINAYLPQFFRGFDNYNTGYVKVPQFLRAMHNGRVPLSFEQSEFLIKFFSDIRGFNYTKFLHAVGAAGEYKSWNQHVIWDKEKPKRAKSREKLTELPLENEKGNLKDVLDKVKDVVYRNKLRIRYFFEQFDRNKLFYLDRDQFLQAMGSTYNFPLSIKEYNILMDGFCASFDKNIIFYQDFLRLVEEVDYQKGLEKNPLIVPVPHVPNRFLREYNYSKAEMESLNRIWEKIGSKWRNWREWEVAKDEKIGCKVTSKSSTITRQNFDRTLSMMNIFGLLSDYERELLFDAYSVEVGREKRFDLLYFMRAAEQVYKKTRNAY